MSFLLLGGTDGTCPMRKGPRAPRWTREARNLPVGLGSPILNTTMTIIGYLLVERSSIGFRLYRNWEADVPDGSNFQVLLDHATTTIYNFKCLDPAQKVGMFAYKLRKPILPFNTQSPTEINEQLGPLNDDFFAETILCPPKGSFLESGDENGKIIIVFEILKKRVALGPSVGFDRLKRQKLATTAPSTLAQPLTYEAIQYENSQRILDDRPVPDADVPPVPLLYDGFGHFLDIVDGATDVPHLDEVDGLKLQLAVDYFAQEMSGFYSVEDHRRTIALSALDTIFAARSGTKIPSFSPASVGSVGHNIGKHGTVIAIAGLRNHTGGNNTMPEIEITAHVARAHVTGMDGEHELFEGWRVPSIGITIVGADVKFYAIILVGLQYRLASLTPALSCLRCAADGRDRKALYMAFTAASVLQARIIQDAESYLTIPPPKIPDGTHRLPAISRLRRYGSSDSDSYLQFEIQHLHEQLGYRLLYLATTSIGGWEKTIVIKFARRYSIELHAFCAARGHAPNILAFETLPGGWQAVAMEYISSGAMITLTPVSLLDMYRERWTNELLGLVQAFHETDLVHGDLRDVNILCDGDQGRVLLIDFDWGGREGEVYYPTPNLNHELLEGRQPGDLRITKDDDMRVLRKTLDKLTR